MTVAVPGTWQDVSVVGYDGIPESASFIPPPTSVHQDFGAVGRLRVRSLLRQIHDDRPERGTTLVPTRPAVRAGTAPPPA